MKCWKCGKAATRSRDITQPVFFYGHAAGREEKPDKYKRCYCEQCFNEYIKTQEEDNKQYILLKKKRMFETALEKLEDQRLIFEDYKEAIKAVEEFNLENLNKFDSSYEIIAAIILIQNRIKSKTQYKIGKYSVDFYLSDYNIALEIDGDRHTKARDAARDAKLHRIKPDLEIIHIPTEHLDKDAQKLIVAINAVLKLRRQHIWSTAT